MHARASCMHRYGSRWIKFSLNSTYKTQANEQWSLTVRFALKFFFFGIFFEFWDLLATLLFPSEVVVGIHNSRTPDTCQPNYGISRIQLLSFVLVLDSKCDLLRQPGLPSR